MSQDHHVHRTYEPLKFLSRLTVFPLAIKKKTPIFTLTVTHEADPPWRWAPTFVVKLGPLPFGVAFGWWIDSDVEDLTQEFLARQEAEELQAEYDRYVAVNGEIDLETWMLARAIVLDRGGDTEDPLEIQGALELGHDPASS